MSASLLEHHPLLSAFVFIAGTIALALGSYGLMRAALGRRADDERRELAGSVIFRVSALHGLILALVFAQEQINLRDVSTAASQEAVAVGDVYFDLVRYDRAATEETRRAVADYALAVVEDEWPRLAANKTLDDSAWMHWEKAYEGILALAPANDRQAALRDTMLREIRAVSGLRRDRENAALTGVDILFLIAAIVGVILTSASYFTFAPTRLNLFLLSVFASYTGLIIYFVVAFSNPYHAPGMAHPVGFERLVMGEIGELARRE